MIWIARLLGLIFAAGLIYDLADADPSLVSMMAVIGIVLCVVATRGMDESQS